jgi:hypothetical protein
MWPSTIVSEPSAFPAFPSHFASSTDNTDMIDIDMIPDLRPCNHVGASPESVPIRLSGEKMSLLQPAFSGDPRGLIGAEDDPWECVVDPA